MKKIDQSFKRNPWFSYLSKGLILLGLIFGFSHLTNAQEGASFYNSVDGEIINEVTVGPGESFTMIVGVENSVLVDGVTATLLFDPALMQHDGETVVDLVGPLLPFPFANEVDNEVGMLTFTKAMFGGAVEPGEFEYMEVTFIANGDVVFNTTTEIMHELEGNDKSDIVHFGVQLLEDSPSMMVTIFTGLDPWDCPDLELNVGDACSTDTGAEGIVDDNCECEAILVWDCPDLEANVGDDCDDGDPSTENDTVTENCECLGTPIWDCPDLEANVGDDCDDGDPNTENDTVTDNCECIGTPIWDCPDLEANVGDDCDDGDPNTENDTVTDNCECIGTPIWDCPDLEANIGDDCDDGDPNTEDDTVGTDCVCAGIPIDDCEADGGAIEFEDGGLFYTICVDDGEPSMVSLEVIEESSDDYETTWIITDPDLNLLGIPGTQDAVEGIDFDGAGVGNCLIWVLNFDEENSNALDLAEAFENDEDVNMGDLEGCYDLSNAAEVVRIECDPSDCENWAMFMNDNEGGESDIYGVDISSGDAVLTYITTVDFHAHIAYNLENGLVYVVNNATGYYVTVDPSTAEVTAPMPLSMDIPSITTAVFSADGKLLVGSSTLDKIYSIDISDDSVTEFDAYAPISGGDIAFDSVGMLYLATRSGNGLYEVYPDDVMDDQYIGSVANLVTGMALTDGEQLLTSHNGNANLNLSNLDGSDAGVSYPLMLDGEAFMHHNGDLASGCAPPDNTEGECLAFGTYYSDINRPGVVGSDLYSVSFTAGGDADMTLLTNVPFSAHIAYNAFDDIVYMVNANGAFIRAYDPTLGIFLGDLPIVGGLTDLVAVVYEPTENPEDELGVLYVGSSASDDIHSIDLGTGVATYMMDAPVEGGDLAIKDDMLYLATRTDSKIYDITSGALVEVGGIPSLVNGMAQFNDALGDERHMIIANRNAGVFTKILASDGSSDGMYTARIGGEAVTLYDGDLAAGCGDVPAVIEEGGCYATEVVEYIEGSAMGGGSIPVERADPTQALGAPEGTDELVFVALGYGGSLTVGFGGSVPNGEGDDIEVVETSFNNPGCASYPEFADVYVSMDGVDWHMAGNVCKGDPFVDISDAGDFDYVMYVMVVNTDETTTSSDGFDVDGIVALHNCEDDGTGDEAPTLVADVSVMTSYPNPTNGPAQVIFTTSTTGRTLVEVYDMNGRNVKTLFNQVAQEDQEYRLDFDGSYLPNGVYVYRMTTDNETIVSKFMIAK